MSKVSFKVSLEKCIGCGLCTNIAPSFFILKNFKAFFLFDFVEIDNQMFLDEICNCCFVDAIKFELY